MKENRPVNSVGLLHMMYPKLTGSCNFEPQPGWVSVLQKHKSMGTRGIPANPKLCKPLVVISFY